MVESSGALHGAGDSAGKKRLFRSSLPLALTVLVGLCVTLVVFFAFQAAERDRLRSDFFGMSADRAHAIRTGLAEDFIELDLLGSYVAAANELSQGKLGDFAREFERYAGRIPGQEPDTQILGFIFRVSGTQRAAFEARARREIDAEFEIRDEGAGGSLAPAKTRGEYFPMTVVEPPELGAAVFGLDLATVPAFKTAIDHALTTGRITASASVGLPLATPERPMVWHFLSVHRKLPSTTGGARGEVIGLAASAFRIDQMVELALKDLSPAGIDLELLDPKAPAGQQLLYYHKSRVPHYDSGDVLKSAMSWSTSIDAGDRSWRLTAYPTREFLNRHRAWQSWTLLIGGILLTGFGGVYFSGRLRQTMRVEALVTQRTQDLALEIAKHEQLEKALAESRSTLASQVDRLNQRNQEAQLLNEVGDMLQACLTTEEAYPIISMHAPQLLPGSAGAFYVHDAQQNLYSSLAEWGEEPPTAAAFKAEDCWALRRGKVHAVAGASPTSCRHATGETGGSMCIPLSASGKSIGLMHVTGYREDGLAFAVSVAEHIGLALSNLMLRSDLRQLSIHDPLTGLFNRRYMEETFEIEIRRAERTERPIGVIMLDIDHFKTFNDRFGHAAGDELLRTLGALVRARLRAGDIACRYGGEEFVLILPDASGDAAVQRAEDIRQKVQGLEVRYLDTPLGQVTVSLGVATWPGNGRAMAEIMSAADAALYRAKGEGRNRVITAG
jgi:diguanylate cyclase (GGDEF)-like protein